MSHGFKEHGELFTITEKFYSIYFVLFLRKNKGLKKKNNTLPQQNKRDL